MQAEVIVAMVMSGGSFLGVFVTALFSWLAQRRAKEAAHAVTNNHPENIRDDLDHRFGDIDERMELLKEVTDQSLTISKHALKVSEQVATTVSGVESDIRGVRRDIGRLTDMSLDAIGHPVH